MLFPCSLSKNSYCISINDKRYDYLCKNFEFVGLPPPVLYEGVRWQNGSNRGCVLGHICVLMMAKCLRLPYVIIYEDDAYPRPDALWMFEKIQNYIPNDCGLLKLGSSSIRGDHVKINDLVFQATEGTAFGSHAYIIRYELYDSLIEAMEDCNVPDAAMSEKYYKNCKYKPYGLYLNSMIFIQKNLDYDNLISHQGGERYWYPSATKLFGCTSGLPPTGFSHKLFEADTNGENLCVVFWDKWKVKRNKKTVVLENNVLKTKHETLKLTPISDNTWSFKWTDENTYYLKFKNYNNGTNYYEVLENL